MLLYKNKLDLNVYKVCTVGDSLVIIVKTKDTDRVVKAYVNKDLHE